MKEMRKVRTYGFENGHCSDREGVNSRLDELQAAILRVKLRYLPWYLERRRELADRYDRNLTEKAERVVPGHGVHHAYHLFVVKVSDRDRVREGLARRGVDTGIHYPHPIHLMRGYRHLGYREGSLPQTENPARCILSLPMYPELSEESVDRICEKFNEVVG